MQALILNIHSLFQLMIEIHNALKIDQTQYNLSLNV